MPMHIVVTIIGRKEGSQGVVAKMAVWYLSFWDLANLRITARVERIGMCGWKDCAKADEEGLLDDGLISVAAW